MAGHSAGSMELHRIMTKGQKMPMPMSGDVDRDFAAMMTSHHQQAIEMSEVMLKHGREPDLKALAERMKHAQQKEIAELAPFNR
jgi:uncharacterized protein (DUF305 family)